MGQFQEAVSKRRTNYALGKNVNVSSKQIVAEIEQLVKDVPSAFNMQSARVVVAFGSNHDKIWQITKDILQKIVPEKNFAATEEKINGFAAAYGTVLYFDETLTVESMQKQYAAYADNFPVWAQQANGMLQFAIWTVLNNMGLGVNLQHYNPLIDDQVKKLFNVPPSWKLIAQMPFGEPLQVPGPIEKIDVSERVKIF
ncbi:nitroreductase family protein [Pectinatus haikarae]|uniref:Oxidoreductase (Fatty acid repression mutant protein) n=1 Tax=Pectinatus haikarae TaxID=349096 RepID=A0ABT9Y690_9FIRM|nr:nitroreductase family protein [Pectinatus haikarae]MDQ0203342.1 putative oxidoreductase (fatty acid repression mutant protein) [Pectinatus haikarae]